MQGISCTPKAPAIRFDFIDNCVEIERERVELYDSGTAVPSIYIFLKNFWKKEKKRKQNINIYYAVFTATSTTNDVNVMVY